MDSPEVAAARERLRLYEEKNPDIYDGLIENDYYGTAAQEAYERSIRDLNADMELVADADAGVIYKYARRYENGTYYCWRGECGSSPHLCHKIENASLFDNAQEALFWCNDEKVCAVKVRITYKVVD